MSAPRNSAKTFSAQHTARGRTTTWVELRAEIMSRIYAGLYPAGQLIPPEKELAQEFGCARATVNRALSSLADRGVLDRRRRIGTRVLLDVSQRKNACWVPTARDLVERAGLRFSFVPLGVFERPAPDAVVKRMFCSNPAALVESRTKLYAEDNIVSLEIRWHDSDAIPGLLESWDQGLLGNEWLSANARISHIEHHLSAVTAESVDATEHLSCEPGQPVMLYEICLWIDTSPVSYARYVMRPGAAIPAQLG